ncbi:hypothetical protein KR009_011458, partial [Drosophila setifemur]
VMISKYAEKLMEKGLLSSRDSLIRLDRAKTLIGWVPPSRDSRFWWLHYAWTAFPLFMLCIYMPYALIMTGILNFKNFTINELFTYLQAPVNASAGIAKTIIFFIMQDRYRRVEAIMHLMDKRGCGKDERILIHNRASVCHLITFFYNGLYFGFLTTAVVGAMWTGKTPFCLYNPLFHEEDGLLSFLMADMVETITVGFYAIAHAIFDVYPVVCVIILRTHINLLKRRIENLRSDLEKSDDQHYSELVECVKDYQLIIEYGNIVRPVISGTVAVQLLSTGILLGLSAAAMLFFTTFVERVVSAYYSLVILFQTFPFSYVCEQLIGDSNDLSITLFHSKWIGAERRYRTTLRNFMHHVQPPIFFTACGIFPISLNTNIKMAKFAFSVLAIVKGMNLVDKLK